jgi:FkbM family methyltransferase
LLRAAHDPDRRSSDWIAGWFRAKWSGPEYFLETRYYTEWQAFFFGAQCDRIHRFIKANVRADWVSADVGANYGFYSVLLAFLSPKGEVHSFEPVPWLCERIARNAKRNGLEAAVHISQVALSNVSGDCLLAAPAEGDVGHGLASILPDRDLWRWGRPQKVPALTLDEYVDERRLQRLDFIKIDVEGAEHLVIEGARRTMAKFRPAAVVEINESSFPQVSGTLARLGYTAHKLPRLPTRFWAAAKDVEGDCLFLPPD